MKLLGTYLLAAKEAVHAQLHVKAVEVAWQRLPCGPW